MIWGILLDNELNTCFTDNNDGSCSTKWHFYIEQAGQNISKKEAALEVYFLSTILQKSFGHKQIFLK